MRHIGLVTALIIGAYGAGCSKRSPETAAAAPAKASVSVEAATPEAASTPPAEPGAPAAEPAAATGTTAPPGTYAPPVEQAMGQLTMFVQQFYYEFRRVPKDVSELVKPAGYLPYIYAPPPGKKWVIDAAKKEVKLADK